MNIHNPQNNVSDQMVEMIPALRAFSRTFYRSASDADDLVQETLLKALANVHQFREGTQLRSWLFTIMRNTFCTRFRIARRQEHGELDSNSLKASVQPDQEWHLRGHEFEAAYRHLPEHYRTVFEYVLLEGRSYEQAAEHFRCPVGTIKSRVNRARSRLAEQLG